MAWILTISPLLAEGGYDTSHRPPDCAWNFSKHRNKVSWSGRDYKKMGDCFIVSPRWIVKSVKAVFVPGGKLTWNWGQISPQKTSSTIKNASFTRSSHALRKHLRLQNPLQRILQLKDEIVLVLVNDDCLAILIVGDNSELCHHVEYLSTLFFVGWTFFSFFNHLSWIRRILSRLEWRSEWTIRHVPHQLVGMGQNLLDSNKANSETDRLTFHHSVYITILQNPCIYLMIGGSPPISTIRGKSFQPPISTASLPRVARRSPLRH